MAMSLTDFISSESKRIEHPRCFIDKPLTLEEFCELVNEDSNVELVDGVIIMRTPASTPHENIFGFLYAIMRAYVRARNLGAVYGSRSLVRINRYTGREPDLLFVRKDRFSIIGIQEITEAPDLIVEIISPGDKQSEIIRKQAQYELIGVPGFWLIDLPRRRVSQFLLDEEGRYQTAFVGSEGTLHCQVIEGFEIQVEWLWLEAEQFLSEYEVLQSLLQD